MTFGVNTSPLAGREGKFVTSRQIKARLEKEVLGNVSIEVRPAEIERHVRGPRPRRAPAGRPHRADAPRGLRADGVAPGGPAPRGRRRGPGAVRADHDRHPARLHRRGPDGARRPQGPPRADVDRRRRPRPDGVRPAGPRPDRLSRPAADRHARDGAAPPDRRGLRAVGRRGHPPHERRARRPTGPGRRTRTACSTSRSAPSCSSAPASRSTRG